MPAGVPCLVLLAQVVFLLQSGQTKAKSQMPLITLSTTSVGNNQTKFRLYNFGQSTSSTGRFF